MDKLEKIVSGIAHLFAILPSTPWWSFLTTLMGPVVGAVVAWWGTYYLARKTEKARQKILITGIWFKVVQMAENCRALHLFLMLVYLRQAMQCQMKRKYT
ncbi:MAG: hypothetical protein COA84_12335 [Robiginitomaculum sp.]|nr:MAG: hypothetical protein COA84_12335 [Robiginitomaculum sp.]